MGIIYKNGIPYGNQPSTDAAAMIEPSEEASATSAHAYAVGEHFIYNGTLYRATAAIAIGDTITPDTNCVATNVMTEVESGGGGGGGTSDYTQLSNKPQINGVTLTGNKSLSDIGAASQSDLEDLEDITGDGQLSGFTATDLTGAANELRNTLTQLKIDTFGSINLIGTNNTGSTITAGTFFYNNGSLVRAKTAIQNGSVITIGTNAETVTAGGLNSLPQIGYVNVDLSGTAVTVSDSGWYYASVAFPNTFPSGANAISIVAMTNFDASVEYRIYNNNRILVISPTSKNLGSNRNARLYYYK